MGVTLVSCSSDPLTHWGHCSLEHGSSGPVVPPWTWLMALPLVSSFGRKSLLPPLLLCGFRTSLPHLPAHLWQAFSPTAVHIQVVLPFCLLRYSPPFSLLSVIWSSFLSVNSWFFIFIFSFCLFFSFTYFIPLRSSKQKQKNCDGFWIRELCSRALFRRLEVIWLRFGSQIYHFLTISNG